MKNSFLNKLAATSLTVAMVVSLSSFSKGELGANKTSKTARVATVAATTLPNVISTNLSVSGDIIIDGKVYVTSGATLTIAAGSILRGVYKTLPENASALVILKGAKIIAQGTATSPIVMTGLVHAANPSLNAGDWGGLVVLGRAKTNQINPIIEGINTPTLPAEIAPGELVYGGASNGDSSGVLSYVRVEYAGALVTPNNELNSFTFGGVGNGTQLDHLQAYKGADDAFEFFGGTVNAKYLIATTPNDDAFDFDFGYSGRLQFIVSTLSPTADYSSGANAIESDNDALSSANLPITRAVISNATLVGTVNGATSSLIGLVQFGAHVRRNSNIILRNSVLYGYKTLIQDDSPQTFSVSQNVLSLIPASVAVGAGTAFAPGFTLSTSTNSTPLTNAITLSSPFDYAGFYSTLRRLRPTATTANLTDADTGAVFTGFPAGSGINGTFTTTAYKGAFPTTSTSTGTTYWINEAWVNKFN